eukprot:4444081-Prymnesium_polylepis.1
MESPAYEPPPAAAPLDELAAYKAFDTWSEAAFRAHVPQVASSTTSLPSAALVTRLMGCPARRASAMRFSVTNLIASREEVRAALESTGTPSSLPAFQSFSRQAHVR